MAQLESFIAEYGVLFVFVGTLFEGETIVILAGFLSHQGVLNPAEVAVAAFLGSWINDQGLFYIARYSSNSRLVQEQKGKPVFAKALAMIERNANQFILAFRFLYGLRTVSPLALGVSNVPALRYLVLNTIAAAIWAPVMTAIGYTLSIALHGAVGKLEQAEHRIGAAIGIAVVAALVVAFIARRNRRISRAADSRRA
jgi:membrane protein DedA with SNARE-associated domain